MRSITFIFALLFLSFFSLFAQVGKNTLLTTGNSGLPDNYTYTSVIDKNGNFWVNTAGGIGVFNGKIWDTIKHNNEILLTGPTFSMCVDSTNAVWIAGESGVYKISEKKVTVYNSLNNTLPIDLSYAVACGKSGEIWIATTAGVVQINGDKITLYNATNSNLKNEVIVCLTVDTSGTVIAGSSDGLFSFDGTQWTVISGSPKALEAKWPKLLFTAKDNNLYIGTEENGIIIYDGKSFNTINALNNNLPSDGISRITQAPDGSMWFATWAGVVQYTDSVQKLIDTNSGLTSNWISGVNFSSDGTIWIATQDGVFQTK